VLNSTYSVAFAAKNMANEKSAASLYGNLDKQQIINLIRAASFRNQFDNDALPTKRAPKLSSKIITRFFRLSVL